MKKLIFIVVLALASHTTLFAQKNLKVWIVCQAEKDSTSTNPDDPELSAQGAQRAEALMQTLQSKKIDTIYITGFKQSKLTAFPLADKRGIPMRLYDEKQAENLVQLLKQYASGKNILIVGSSHNLISLLNDFGTQPAVDSIATKDDTKLFHLNIRGGKVRLTISNYRNKSRTGEL